MATCDKAQCRRCNLFTNTTITSLTAFAHNRTLTMAAATLPLSRSMRIPLSNRQDTNQVARIPEEWGPSSVPPAAPSNVPWDDQVVPALRKKLEAQSQDLSKRISRIEESDQGWDLQRSRESYDRRGPDRRMSREVVQQHQRESSVDQFHNRFASVRAAPSRQRSGDTLATAGFAYDPHESNDVGLAGRGGEAASVTRNDATARARQKARQIARQKAAAGLGDSTMMSSTDTYGERQQDLESSVEAIPEGKVAGSRTSSFERKRMRTQSTPMRPSLDVVDPEYSGAGASRRGQIASVQETQRSHPSTSNPGGHQRSNSLSRRKAAAAASMDPKLMEEFGPLGATPSPKAKLLRAHQDYEATWTPSSASPSTRQRNLQPDAFRSLSRSDQIRLRESSAPPAFGQDDTTVSEFGASPASKSVNSWEDEIIPTVARKLQQEQFLKAGKEGRLSRYEGLIDTWDKNGLPLSRSDVIAMQRATRMHEEHGQAQQAEEEQEAEAEAEEQMLTPGPLVQKKESGLSPVDVEYDRRSRASSRRSQRSSQPEGISMQTFDRHPAPSSPVFQQQQPQATVQQPVMETSQPPAATAATAAKYQDHTAGIKRHNDDKVDKGGCCCIVM